MRLDFGWANVELYASAPYSVRDQSPLCVLGLAFERQRGVHGIDGERRRDFDAWPGDLAYASPNVEIFSESAHGGEYLAVRVARDAVGLPPETPLERPRVVLHGERRAMLLGAQLRRMLLAPQPSALLVEQHVALLLEHGVARLKLPRRTPGAYALERTRHARVLEYIDAALDMNGPLGLEQLARVAQMPPLRFLRSFSSAVGATPHAYITERRLQRARAQLRSSADSVAAIAADCGFAHQSHLGAVFKERLGMSPLQFRTLHGRAGRRASAGA
ncbi:MULTISPECIES: helix-turn-helix transcriptional regulator [unclassified Janthinobacterium]|uniref:helix-turn-helix transcriptional regulator n=1 Tax=unclassified Janthinobacterium TaxID=2610881 RepID=UPI00036DEDC6|nr:MULTISPECIES: helix-turn-helix transcriptional regulator [unclassified Janthinobacterium]MEC5162493.1 AraC family transcriptional regulator [Janthinobacterium sp. CG_S6]